MSRRLNRRKSGLLFVPNLSTYIKHSITSYSGNRGKKKQMTFKENGRENSKLKQKLKETLIINRFLLPFLFFLWVDSFSAPIHLRSPHSGVFREGQNPENRLHTRHFVTRHPSPASQRQGAAHNWDTASAKNTLGGVEQHLCMHLHPIRSAFTLHLLSFWKKQRLGRGDI